MAGQLREVDPLALFGVAAGTIPHSNHNQGPRLLFAASMVKQRIPVAPLRPPPPVPHHFTMWHGQRPIATTRPTEEALLSPLGGVNAVSGVTVSPSNRGRPRPAALQHLRAAPVRRYRRVYTAHLREISGEEETFGPVPEESRRRRYGPTTAFSEPTEKRRRLGRARRHRASSKGIAARLGRAGIGVGLQEPCASAGRSARGGGAPFARSSWGRGARACTSSAERMVPQASDGDVQARLRRASSSSWSRRRTARARIGRRRGHTRAPRHARATIARSCAPGAVGTSEGRRYDASARERAEERARLERRGRAGGRGASTARPDPCA